MRERTIVINELWIADDSGEVPFTVVAPIAGDVPFASFPSVPSSMYYTVNGQLIPDITMQPGEAQRFRVLNACPHRSIWLHVEGHSLEQIGTMGRPTPPAHAPAHFLGVGHRAEFIIKAGEPGRYRIYAEAYDQGHPGGSALICRWPPGGARQTDRHTDGEDPGGAATDANLPVSRRRVLVFSGDISGRPVWESSSHRR
ncbi:multicopper oxidase family protein [Mycobacterium ulcerans str. Harvey]|uniref:Multicopper oxidase family protein n=1 Tax=Mycobacterium ulcerans str. Harvey TaxID=1299332 RepID=A0ABN0RAV7_MYCUL|nr:multicopper oxidase family protein [Mycobacterium ulcerans str. Harvey]